MCATMCEQQLLLAPDTRFIITCMSCRGPFHCRTTYNSIIYRYRKMIVPHVWHPLSGLCHIECWKFPSVWANTAVATFRVNVICHLLSWMVEKYFSLSLFRTTFSPKHFSLSLFINCGLTPYWLSPYFFVLSSHGFLSDNCPLWDLHKSFQFPSAQIHWPWK